MAIKRDGWFRVDADGFRQLQEGREPWELVRELVANAWDEPIHICRVELRPDEHDTMLVVEDDSPSGFADLSDAYTLFRRNEKRCRPDVRGRFNLGEKEILSTALWAKVVSTKGAVEFCPDGTIRRPRARREIGTKIELRLRWGQKARRAIFDRLWTFLPPEGKKLVIASEFGETVIAPRKPDFEIEAVLDTVLESEEGLRPTKRKTEIRVHRTGSERGLLYEMGIPVCEIDAPYLVNVQQKVPLSTERNTVKPAYLRDVLAEVLNVVATEIPAENASATWVHSAVEDERVAPEAVRAVVKKRYEGRPVVLWSPDHRAVERAREEGYEVVHPKTLSAEERASLIEKAGVKHASEVFPTDWADAEMAPESEWTFTMRRFARLAKDLATSLLGHGVIVQWIDSKATVLADYNAGSRVLRFNRVRLGPAWTDATALRAEHLSLLLHELAHDGEGNGHDWQHAKMIERLAGECAMLALKEPEVFAW